MEGSAAVLVPLSFAVQQSNVSPDASRIRLADTRRLGAVGLRNNAVPVAL